MKEGAGAVKDLPQQLLDACRVQVLIEGVHVNTTYALTLPLLHWPEPNCYHARGGHMQCKQRLMPCCRM